MSNKFLNRYKLFWIFIIYNYFYWHFYIFKFKLLLLKTINNNKQFLILDFVIAPNKIKIFWKK